MEETEKAGAPIADVTTAESGVTVVAAPKRRPPAPGKRYYETLLLIFSKLDDKALETFKNDFRAGLEAGGASDITIEDLGRKKLAYEIRDQKDGIYVNFIYAAPPALIATLDRKLKLNESVMRFMTTLVDWE